MSQLNIHMTPALESALNRFMKARGIATQSEARLDYVEFFDPETLEPVEKVKRGTQMALAVFIGKTRLIDNGNI